MKKLKKGTLVSIRKGAEVQHAEDTDMVEEHGRLWIVLERTVDDSALPHHPPGYDTKSLATGEEHFWYDTQIETRDEKA